MYFRVASGWCLSHPDDAFAGHYTHTPPPSAFCLGRSAGQSLSISLRRIPTLVHTIDIIYTTQWRPCKQMRDGTKFLKSPADHTVTRVSDRSWCAQKCFATNGAASPLSRARRATSRSRSRTRRACRCSAAVHSASVDAAPTTAVGGSPGWYHK